jgi:hypothetical protein
MRIAFSSCRHASPDERILISRPIRLRTSSTEDQRKLLGDECNTASMSTASGAKPNAIEQRMHL